MARAAGIALAALAYPAGEASAQAPDGRAASRSDSGDPATVPAPRGENALFEPHPVARGEVAFRPGSGLVVESADGRFSLVFRSRAQMLYTLEHDPSRSGRELQHGLQIRRARLTFRGHTFSRHVSYNSESAVAPSDVGLNPEADELRAPLLDWYVDVDYLRDLSLRVGRYKVPYNRQRVISSGDLQLVDRALAQAEFTVDRDIGLDLRSKDLFGAGRLRYYAGAYFGEGRSAERTGDLQQMYLGRVEWLPTGLFDDYSEVDFARERRARVSIGAAYAYLAGAERNRGIVGPRPSDRGTTDYHSATVDLMLKVAGFSMISEFYLRTGTRNPGPVVDAAGEPIRDEVGRPLEIERARNGAGWFVQAGYLFPRSRFEIAGRVGAFGALGDRSSMERRGELGGGLNYYFARHPLKLQADVFQELRGASIADGAVRARLQLQVSL